jgi:multiple sugar transport system ATP-binding protein
MRARQVAHYHGDRVFIGFRAEAITPVAADAQGDVLHGRVHYVEHHGHESLAFIDVGAVAVSLDEYGPPAEGNANNGRGGRIAGMFRRGRSDAEASARSRAMATAAAPGNGTAPTNGNGRSGAHAAPEPEQAGRHTRQPAELAVRLQPYPALRVGEPMSIGVRIDQLHFFDPQGNRIDVGWR